jgi:archaellum component FlaF (FlaF/FlaG flagellin family)
MLIEFVRHGSFVAEDPEHNSHEIEIVQEVVHNGEGVIDPQCFLRLRNGEVVSKNRTGEYVIAGSNTILSSNDPSCP